MLCTHQCRLDDAIFDADDSIEAASPMFYANSACELEWMFLNNVSCKCCSSNAEACRVIIAALLCNLSVTPNVRVLAVAKVAVPVEYSSCRPSSFLNQSPPFVFFLDEVPKVKRSLTWVPWPTFRYQHWRPKFVHCTTRWIVVHWLCHLKFKHILIRCLTNIFLDITAALVFQVSDALLPEQAWIKRGLALHARDLAPTRRVYGLGNASTTFCRRAILENWICTAHVTDIISMSTIFS